MSEHISLRPLKPSEKQTLTAKIRDLSLAARVHQRYRIVDQVRRGFSLAETAARVGCHFTVAYDWIHRFNQTGFTTFEQVANPKGRPPILRAEQLRELVEVALSNLQERGLPFSNWSVPKLAEYCRARHLLPGVTDEWVRRLLRREGLTAQRIRTWKTSNDVNFDRKKTDPEPLSCLSAAWRRSLFRRMGAIGGPSHGRRSLGPEGAPSTHAGYLSPAPRDRAFPGILRCP